MLRLVFGDEHFLKEHELGIDYNAAILSMESSRNGSAPSSHRLLMSENPYFLATNASIFDRNPF